jgi:hypothetical protein
MELNELLELTELLELLLEELFDMELLLDELDELSQLLTGTNQGAGSNPVRVVHPVNGGSWSSEV